VQGLLASSTTAATATAAATATPIVSGATLQVSGQ
jgi:hypothetical protein